ncbi:hypothetical protein OUZ56_029356 [Daphnia magna]|uniref:Uncharacterized protein n=1 Tax=Daphnia magna TaxID=35525 RepID=A0ABR0B6L1_9CRUS|nr:hypothetical protein OUZ56_029356 [Daphnia magna]
MSGSKYETRIFNSRHQMAPWELARQHVVHGNIARWRHQELGIVFRNPALDGATKILLHTVAGAENDH